MLAETLHVTWEHSSVVPAHVLPDLRPCLRSWHGHAHHIEGLHQWSFLKKKDVEGRKNSTNLASKDLANRSKKGCPEAQWQPSCLTVTCDTCVGFLLWRVKLLE